MRACGSAARLATIAGCASPSNDVPQGPADGDNADYITFCRGGDTFERVSARRLTPLDQAVEFIQYLQGRNIEDGWLSASDLRGIYCRFERDSNLLPMPWLSVTLEARHQLYKYGSALLCHASVIARGSDRDTLWPPGACTLRTRIPANPVLRARPCQEKAAQATVTMAHLGRRQGLADDALSRLPCFQTLEQRSHLSGRTRPPHSGQNRLRAGRRLST